VAAGGDETYSRHRRSYRNLHSFGIIPVGTGNLIAHELNIPLEIAEAVALIAGAHKSRQIDALRIGKRVYVLNASLGISALSPRYNA